MRKFENLEKDCDLDDFDVAVGEEMLDLDKEHGRDYRITSADELLDVLERVVEELSGNEGRFPPLQYPHSAAYAAH